MTNRTLIAALMAMAAATGLSQNKISMDGLKYMDRYRQQSASAIKPLGTSEISNEIAVIATLCPGYTASDIEEAGYRVTNSFGQSVIVSMTIDEVERFAELEAVQSLTFGGKKKMKLDGARQLTGVDAAHNGIELNGTTRSFTGKVVIVGMFDGGLEPNHLNFLDDSGASRIERLWVYSGQYGRSSEYYASTLKSFESDDKDESHATHVAGILTGSYKGNGTYAYTSNTQLTGTSTTRTDQPIPYYGVAYDATPVFSVGTFYDPNILDGVGKIVDYAKQEGKPCVVNLSLGSNVGPHDGTDDFTSALNELGRDAIIVLSSGNEGDMDMSVTKTFTANETSLSTFLMPDATVTTSIEGDIDIWASDWQPLTVTLLTYNKNTKTTTTLATSSRTGTTASTTKTGLSSGRGTIYAEVNGANDRYNVCISPSTALRLSANYYLMIKIEGTPGQKVNMYYSDYGNFTSNNVAGFTSGSASESINAIGTADNLITVGSFVSRTGFGVLKESSLYSSWGEPVGQISSFSSYGTLPDGTKLPYVLAPGSSIISSYSKYYVEGAGASSYEGKDMMTGKATNPNFNNYTDYWGAMDGTSMAAPFASGVIALWLEADPTLDVEGIKDVLAHSSTSDIYTRRKPAAAGYGKINAEAGLKYILSNVASTGTVTDDPERRLLITPGTAGFDIVMGGEASFTATMFDLQGRPVARTTSSGACATLSTSAVAPGIYVIAVEGKGASIARKVTVK